MLNNLDYDNNITRILDFMKYSVAHYFLILGHMRLQQVTLTTR